MWTCVLAIIIIIIIVIIFRESLKHLLSAYVPYIALGTGNTVISKIDMVSLLMKFTDEGRRHKKNKQLQFKSGAVMWNCSVLWECLGEIIT